MTHEFGKRGNRNINYLTPLDNRNRVQRKPPHALRECTRTYPRPDYRVSPRCRTGPQGVVPDEATNAQFLAVGCRRLRVKLPSFPRTLLLKYETSCSGRNRKVSFRRFGRSRPALARS